MNRPYSVAFVLKGYPRLSETFIAREILGLETRGLDIGIVSLRRPTEDARHPIHDAIRAPVHYLPEYLHAAPEKVFRAWRSVRRLAGYGAAWRVFRADLKRDFTRNRIRRFGQACALAAMLPPTCRHIHAHFIHTPASVARYAALMREIPFSVSAHAKDIWLSEEWDLADKLQAARFAVTCTEYGRERLMRIAPDASIRLAYHGYEGGGEAAPSLRDGSDPLDPARLLSVGRAVEKKGFEDILEALARLPTTVHWRFEHIGGGERLASLRTRAEALGLSSRIVWRGGQSEDAVIDAYRRADLFLLASKIAADGDRDGLPNVLMEAQSFGVACIATRTAAIPELIDEGETGLLANSGDIAGLASAITGLIADPGRRRALGLAGRRRVAERFSPKPGLDLLCRLFGLDEVGS